MSGIHCSCFLRKQLLSNFDVFIKVYIWQTFPRRRLLSVNRRRNIGESERRFVLCSAFRTFFAPRCDVQIQEMRKWLRNILLLTTFPRFRSWTTAKKIYIQFFLHFNEESISKVSPRFHECICVSNSHFHVIFQKQFRNIRHIKYLITKVYIFAFN